NPDVTKPGFPPSPTVWFLNSSAALARSTLPLESVGTLMLLTAVQVDTSDAFFVIRTLSSPGAAVTHAVNKSAKSAVALQCEIIRIERCKQWGMLSRSTSNGEGEGP